MAPGVTVDTTPGFDPSVSNNVPSSNGRLPRTLLLSPPSLAAMPERLDAVLEAHDRSATDIQMLDRLALGLVSLPPTTYDSVIILSDADNTRSQSQRAIDRSVFGIITASLKPGGTLRSQDNTFAIVEDTEERREVILAGLVFDNGVVKKPASEASASVPLRFGKNKAQGGPTSTTVAAGTGAPSLDLNGNGKRTNGDAAPTGVGFVDFSDDFDDPMAEVDSDDELIDEDTLLDESDLIRPIIQRKLQASSIAARCSLSNE